MYQLCTCVFVQVNSMIFFTNRLLVTKMANENSLRFLLNINKSFVYSVRARYHLQRSKCVRFLCSCVRVCINARTKHVHLFSHSFSGLLNKESLTRYDAPMNPTRTLLNLAALCHMLYASLDTKSKHLLSYIPATKIG
jgi:hypothetical protein